MPKYNEVATVINNRQQQQQQKLTIRNWRIIMKNKQ